MLDEFVKGTVKTLTTVNLCLRVVVMLVLTFVFAVLLTIEVISEPEQEE